MIAYTLFCTCGHILYAHVSLKSQRHILNTEWCICHCHDVQEIDIDYNKDLKKRLLKVFFTVFQHMVYTWYRGLSCNCCWVNAESVVRPQLNTSMPSYDLYIMKTTVKFILMKSHYILFFFFNLNNTITLETQRCLLSQLLGQLLISPLFFLTWLCQNVCHEKGLISSVKHGQNLCREDLNF